ncbi:MAG: hypothetical protein HOV80_02720 [Polyangiaceae bacterium]|nr:hypothetical protein [Polyangiaceae bacterium]
MPRFRRRVPGTSSRVGINPFTRERVEIPGRPPGDKTVDVDVVGLQLVTVTTTPGKKPKTERAVFATEVAARGQLASKIRSLLARGFQPPTPEATRPASAILIDELLAEGSPRFALELALFTGKKLGTLAERWFKDTRPGVRQMLLDYVRAGVGRAEHKPLVKRLFYLAEDAKDDELMALFAMAFDRLEKRWLVEVDEYDLDASRMVKEPGLVASPLLRSRTGRNDKGPFTRHTRQYLCRRAFRYFRQIAYSDAGLYVRALAPALAEMTDEDLGDAARFLDAWTVVHVLYWGSEILERNPRGIRIRYGESLANLKFAPLKPKAWGRSFDIALEMAATARSRPVAGFAVHLLETHHQSALEKMPFATAKRLLGAAHETTRAFMIARLGRVSDLATQPVGEWLALVEGGTLETLPEIVRLFREHVAPRRLSLEECVTLSLSPAAAVAELGLTWVKERAEKGLTALERQRLLRLASARAPLVRKAAADYLAELLAKAPEAKPEEVRELLDAGDADVRARAMTLLDQSDRFAKSPVVWASMAESPHADVRDKLLGALYAQATETPPPAHPDGPKVDDAALARLWSTTLLSIHRGSRVKPKALATMAAALEREPSRAEAIVPLMRIALRSVRPTERRAALAAIARAAQAHVEVRVAASRHLPELSLGAIDVEVIA